MYYYICTVKNNEIILVTHNKFSNREEAEKYLREGTFLVKAGEDYFND